MGNLINKLVVYGIMLFLISNIITIPIETSSYNHNDEIANIIAKTSFDEKQNRITLESMDVELRWIKELDYNCEALEIIDINYDGYYEIITGQTLSSYQGRIDFLCINGDDGSYNWYKKSQQNHLAKTLCVSDIDNDGIQEILSICTELYCYDAFGNFKWKEDYRTDYYNNLAIIDPNNNGLFDIFLTSGHTITKLDYSGDFVWEKDMGAQIEQKIAFADIDKTGGFNIIVPTDSGNISCLDSQGEAVWRRNYLTGYHDWESDAIIADLDATYGLEILIQGGVDLYCLDCYGNVLWTKSGVHSSNGKPVIVADVNNDNKLEIITNTYGVIRCLDNLGSITWEYSIGDRLRAEPLIADLNGDGYCEILVFLSDSGGDARVVCLDYQGNLVWTYNIPKGEINNACILDVDLDGVLEIVFLYTHYVPMVQDGPSTIYCLNLLNVINSGVQHWSSDGGSTYNTGCIDSDGDSIDDFTEANWESNINSYDSDSDTMHDGIELIAGLNPNINDFNSDLDGDGLTNQEELFVYHSNIRNPDVDGDSINDYYEIIVYGTNHSDADTDHDELTDYDEIFVHFTNATNFDSEGDNLPDGWEIQYGFNPWLNDSYLDHDNDTLTAYEEYLAGGSPYSNDTDSDGLLDQDEYYIHGTDAGNENTDGDVMDDFWEVMYGTDPLVDDSLDDPDADFLVNFEEYQEGTDPLDRDTDGDGFVDGDEVMKGYDPLDPDNHPPIPPSPSVKLGVSFVSGIFLAFFTLLMSIGILSMRKLK